MLSAFSIFLAYLLTKTSSSNVELATVHARLMERLSMKNQAMKAKALTWLEMHQALQSEPEDESSAHQEETGYTGSAGFNWASDEAHDPYEQGMTEGFSLVGAGKAWYRAALKGCIDCETETRWGKVAHKEGCPSKNDENLGWFENPRQFEAEQASDDGILLRVAQEEDVLATARKENSSPCDKNHIQGTWKVLNRKGEEVPCTKCHGTGIVFPRCSLCGGTGFFDHIQTQVKCPMCSKHEGMPSWVLGTVLDENAGPVGRDLTMRIHEALAMDAEFIDLGEDWADWILGPKAIRDMVGILNKNHKDCDRLAVLQKRQENDLINETEAGELASLQGTQYMNESQAWWVAMAKSIRQGFPQLDWFLNDEESGRAEKLQALQRILNWSIQQLQKDDQDAKKAILGLINYDTKSWGPYVLERELGSAELMEQEGEEGFGAMWNGSENRIIEDVHGDTVFAYNPARDLSFQAQLQATVNMAMEVIFPKMALGMDSKDIMALAKTLREGRRPHQVTVGEFAGSVVPDSIKNMPLYRGKDETGKACVAFQSVLHGGQWFKLIRQDGTMTTRPIKALNGKDGVSRFSTSTVSDEGIMDCLGLLGASLVQQGKTVEEAANILFQWYPPNYKDGDKLPELAYIKYRVNDKFEVVASRLTKNTLFNQAKKFCQENHWAYDIEEMGWEKSVLCHSDSDQEKLMKLMEDYKSSHQSQLQEAMSQFKAQVETSRAKWKPIYGNWLKERKAHRDMAAQLGVKLGGVKVYSKTVPYTITKPFKVSPKYTEAVKVA